jgi:hypothetical protein
MAVTRKKTSKKAKVTAPDEMRSFRRYPGEKPFFTFRISQQTFYWLIIGALVLGLGIWAITQSVKLQYIYDRVETSAIINE